MDRPKNFGSVYYQTDLLTDKSDIIQYYLLSLYAKLLLFSTLTRRDRNIDIFAVV